MRTKGNSPDTYRFQRRRDRSRPRLELLEGRIVLSGVSFSAPESIAVGLYPGSVAVGDFNGDGRPDMVVGIDATNNVSVQLGNGDGTFKSGMSFQAGPESGAPYIAVGDFNGDGKADLAALNYNSNTVSVLLGNGDGTFQTAMTFGVGAYPSSVTVGDLNGDHKLDLIVPNSGSDNVSVLLGNGDGTFQAAIDSNTGFSPVSATVADFNGDGKADLAVSDFHTSTGNVGNTVSVLLGNGDGTFQAASSLVVGSGPWDVVSGDFNGDGKADLAVMNNRDDTVSVLLGNGDGTFQAAQNDAVGDGPESLAIGDFNEDRKPDLAVVNTGSINVSVLLGNGDGTFQAAQNFAAGLFPVSLVVGNFNGDGRPDIAVTNEESGTVSVLLNQVVPTTAVSGPVSSTYGQSVTYTASMTSGGKPVTVGTVTFQDGNTPLSAALPLNASGHATFSIASLNAGSHAITVTYSGTPGGTGFGTSTGTASLTVKPARLSATGVNVSAIAGAPFTGAVATFTNVDPFGTAASYTALITWGDGSTSAGSITGSGTLTVTGVHTYADPGSDTVHVQISHNLGDTTTVKVTSTATVVTLGQGVQNGQTDGIGFWNNKKGQALIYGFSGGPGATAAPVKLAGGELRSPTSSGSRPRRQQQPDRRV